jgi:O-methyltransferase
MTLLLKKAINHAMAATPYLRSFVLGRYNYMFEPDQLIALCNLVGLSRHVPGLFIEAGCAYGYTTVFLKKYMRRLGIDREYWAIDTFSGFVPDHVSFEVRDRAKPAAYYRDSFALNSKAMFDRSLAWQGITDVVSIQGDVTTFRFDRPIAFCLLDIDLYLPIRIALPAIYESLSPRGVVVVDDCSPDDDRWDGALQAYREFIGERGLPETILASKLGVIVK